MRLTIAVIVMSTLSLPELAAAQSASFGDTGTIAPTGSVSLTYVQSGPDKFIFFNGAPAALYFVMPNLGVGASLTYGHIKYMLDDATGDEQPSISMWGIGPMVAYNVGLQDRVSVLPSLSLSYSVTSMALSDFFEADVSSLVLSIAAPLLLHFDHFFVGFGPQLQADLMKKASSKVMGHSQTQDQDKAFRFLLNSTIGGWF